MRFLAPPGISGGAARELRSPPKTFSLEKAARMHRPAAPPHFCFGLDAQFPPQKHGYTQGSSRAPRVFAIHPLPRPGPRQFPKRAHPIPRPTTATEALASVSSLARAMNRKTSSRNDSKQHVPSLPREDWRTILNAKPLCQGLIIAGLRKILLSQDGPDPPQRRCELVGVVRRRVFELVEEHIDGGSNVVGVVRFCIFAVRDVQRIHGHGGLFGGTLVGKRNVFCVLWNALQHAQHHGSIVLHGGKPLGKTLCYRCGSGGRRRD